MTPVKPSTALAVAHLADAVLEAMELLRRAALARSVFLFDDDVGRLATMGDALNARQRRSIGELARQSPLDPFPSWMWPTIQSTLTLLPLDSGYVVAIVRDDGPIPVADALEPHIARLHERLPTREQRARARAARAAAPALAACSFCGRTSENRKLISGRGVAICADCIVLCQEALAGSRTPTQATELQHRASGLLAAAQRDLASLKFGDAMGSLQGAESALGDLLTLLAAFLPDS
ncbi:MAG: ClpX C4-type zinc finger protein [Acidobacteriota bacterium]